jgi:hypothetical protein
MRRLFTVVGTVVALWAGLAQIAPNVFSFQTQPHEVVAWVLHIGSFLAALLPLITIWLLWRVWTLFQSDRVASERITALEARVAALERPETPLERVARRVYEKGPARLLSP